jgi:hypothetical protein
MKEFLKKNWIDILTGFGIILGIVLVFERANLRRLFRRSTIVFQDFLSNTFHQANQGISGFLGRFSYSDLVGMTLALICIIIIVLRLRYRILASPNWRKSTCPRCGGELHRVHRTSLDRLLARTVLPGARRYLCSDKACRWTGLKNIEPGSRPHHHRSEEVTSDGTSA